MGDFNQLAFVERHVGQFEGPFLEVGSKDYGSTQDLRSLLAGRGEYVGVDVEAGPGVDIVLDLTAPAEQIDRQLGGMRFGTIFCLSVLEHCRQPFLMAQNLARLLRPGGKLCVSVPFAWEFHGYPSDYWRFTSEGIRVLFDGLVFDPDQCTAATSRDREFLPLDRDIARIPFSTKFHWRRGRYIRGVVAMSLRWIGRCGVLGWLVDYPYVLAPTSVMMIGTRRRSENDAAPR